MKKLLFLYLLCISIQVNAECIVYPIEACPKKINCAIGTILSTYGECIGCDSEKPVDIHCIGIDKAKQFCPNRFYEGDDCSGIHSYLRCPEGYTANCDEIKNKSIQEACRKEQDNKHCYIIGSATNEISNRIENTLEDGYKIILDDDKIKREENCIIIGS